jgi:hypothetical protein
MLSRLLGNTVRLLPNRVNCPNVVQPPKVVSSTVGANACAAGLEFCGLRSRISQEDWSRILRGV